MKQTLPLFLVDDDAAILDSLTFMLRQFGYSLQPFSCGLTFLDQVNLTLPGCVILDSRMPVLTGQEIQQRLLDADSPLGIIFLTGHGDLPMAVNAFRQGACDFFQKPVSGKALAEAIEKSMLHSQQAYESTQLRLNLTKLSEREQQVLHLLVQGKTNKQISEALFLSLRTIEVHRSNVMKKLQVHNMAELAKYSHI
ncbi:response regulator transcription factor [Shewanella colwelliana]|uniref:response regulator transcription factor n=1 Tax=Shewanella colwelliana TaxID=23 RepID=UPI0022B0369C|nr:LuxR C-terminal-related transcriptional regulator [Shewanella colwelliana]MCZ4337230.1 LuxR C-terminal-related transcriptional regulator [Shewanella colwelliana]